MHGETGQGLPPSPHFLNAVGPRPEAPNHRSFNPWALSPKPEIVDLIKFSRTGESRRWLHQVRSAQPSD